MKKKALRECIPGKAFVFFPAERQAIGCSRMAASAVRRFASVGLFADEACFSTDARHLLEPGQVFRVEVGFLGAGDLLSEGRNLA